MNMLHTLRALNHAGYVFHPIGRRPRRHITVNTAKKEVYLRAQDGISFCSSPHIDSDMHFYLPSHVGPISYSVANFNPIQSRLFNPIQSILVGNFIHCNNGIATHLGCFSKRNRISGISYQL